MNLLIFLFFTGAVPKVVIEDAESNSEHVVHALHPSNLGETWLYDRIWLRVLFINETSDPIGVPGSPVLKEGEPKVIRLFCEEERKRRFWLTIESPGGDTLRFAGIEATEIGAPSIPTCYLYHLLPGETLVCYTELSWGYAFLEPGTYRITGIFYQVEKGPRSELGPYKTDSFYVKTDYTFRVRIGKVRISRGEYLAAYRSLWKIKGYEPGFGPMLNIFNRARSTNSERIIACNIIAAINNYPQDRELFIGLILDQMRRYPEYLMLTKPFPDSLDGKPFPDYLGKEGIALFDSLMTNNQVFGEAWRMHELFKAWSREWDEKHKGGQ